MTQYIIVLLLGVSSMILNVEADCTDWPNHGKCANKGGGWTGTIERPESLGTWNFEKGGYFDWKEYDKMWPDGTCKIMEEHEMEVRNCMAEEGCCAKYRPQTGCPTSYVPKCTVTDENITSNETLQDVYGDLCEIDSFHRCASKIPLDCKHFNEIRECAVVHRCCSRLDHPPFVNVRNALPSIPSLADCMEVAPESLRENCYDGNLRKMENKIQTDCDPVEWKTCQNKYHAYLGKFSITERADCGMIRPGRDRFMECAMDRHTMCGKELNQYWDNWMTHGGYCTDPSTFPMRFQPNDCH